MHSTHCRLPRAGVDRIDGPADALDTIALAMSRPLRAETIVLVLDESRRGRSIVVVTRTDRCDDVVGVVECLAAGASPDAAALVVASVRPDDSACGEPADDPAGRSDVDRWLEMSELAEGFGVEIVEWFVIGSTVTCPRDDLGEAPRW